MKTLSSYGICSLALAALAAACGGSAATQTGLDPGPADPQFTSAAPSFSAVSLEIDDADANPNSALADNSLQQDATTADCHPHLFSRTHEVVARLNRHTYKLLRHVEDVIKDHPKLKSGTTHVWESVKDGVDRKFTLSLASDGVTWSFELDLGKAAAAGSDAGAGDVKVYSGTIATSTASGVTTSNLSMSFDYDALRSVIPTEKAAGQVTITGKRIHDASKPAPGVQKTFTIAFTNFLPEEGDAHGPRTGSYTHLGEPGVGGSLTFADSLILLCPANPQGKVADTQTVARWFKNSAGGVSGRADAKATGGQMAAGQVWEGVSCRSGAAHETTSKDNENAYWMMKLEDGSGNTVQGSSRESTSGTPPCDAAFGQVPSVTNNATDYDFAAKVSFPGQW